MRIMRHHNDEKRHKRYHSIHYILLAQLYTIYLNNNGIYSDLIRIIPSSMLRFSHILLWCCRELSVSLHNLINRLNEILLRNRFPPRSNGKHPRLRTYQPYSIPHFLHISSQYRLTHTSYISTSTVRTQPCQEFKTNVSKMTNDQC